MPKYEGRKLTASFVTGAQSGPQTWEVWTETLFLTPETRIADIMDWYFRINKQAERIVSIQINEPDLGKGNIHE